MLSFQPLSHDPCDTMQASFWRGVSRSCTQAITVMEADLGTWWKTRLLGEGVAHAVESTNWCTKEGRNGWEGTEVALTSTPPEPESTFPETAAEAKLYWLPGCSSPRITRGSCLGVTA